MARSVGRRGVTGAIKAPIEVQVAQEELERVLEAAKRGIVAPADLNAAEAKVKVAQVRRETVTAELKKLEDEIAVVKAKLKEIEK